MHVLLDKLHTIIHPSLHSTRDKETQNPNLTSSFFFLFILSRKMQQIKQEHQSSPMASQEHQFENSLKELKDLCSQLHQAANHCESSFLNSRHKREVVENTKEYICRAVVTVVDHLGSVSANLECRLISTDSVPEAELRINTLQQRIRTCQGYSQLFARRTDSWNAVFPRYHPRYILPPIQDPPKASLFETEEEVPLFLFSTFDESLQKKTSFSTPVLPVRDGMSILPLKHQHPNFHFLAPRKLKRGMLNWKLGQHKDLRWLISRGRRTLALSSSAT